LLTFLETGGSSFQDETKLIACSSICNLITNNVNAQKKIIRPQANSKLIGVMNADNLRLIKMAIARLLNLVKDEDALEHVILLRQEIARKAKINNSNLMASSKHTQA
jgi:hypothetical protein